MQALQAEVISNFKDELAKIEAGELEHWIDDQNGCLAYIILCDQFHRLIHRRTKKTYQLDEKSKQIMTDMISNQRTTKYDNYRFMEKWLMLMCLTRSENMVDV